MVRSVMDLIAGGYSSLLDKALSRKTDDGKKAKYDLVDRESAMVALWNEINHRLPNWKKESLQDDGEIDTKTGGKVCNLSFNDETTKMNPSFSLHATQLPVCDSELYGGYLLWDLWSNAREGP